MVEHVRPVVLPLLATFLLFCITVAGSPGVPEGGAAAMLVGPAAPRSRMAPVWSTALEGVTSICAIAESTLLGELPQGETAPAQAPFVKFDVGLRAACWLKVATGSP